LVKIRLKRMGATKRPIYRIVVADSRSPRDGRFIETIGFYDPLRDPAIVRVDAEKARTWMRNGARPSDAARALLVREGILAPTPRPARAAPVQETAADAERAPTVAPEVTAADVSDSGEPAAPAQPEAAPAEPAEEGNA
jgi:small subunit ribosomal protein S16